MPVCGTGDLTCLRARVDALCVAADAVAQASHCPATDPAALLSQSPGYLERHESRAREGQAEAALAQNLMSSEAHYLLGLVANVSTI